MLTKLFISIVNILDMQFVNRLAVNKLLDMNTVSLGYLDVAYVRTFRSSDCVLIECVLMSRYDDVCLGNMNAQLSTELMRSSRDTYSPASLR